MYSKRRGNNQTITSNCTSNNDVKMRRKHGKRKSTQSVRVCYTCESKTDGGQFSLPHVPNYKDK